MKKPIQNAHSIIKTFFAHGPVNVGNVHDAFMEKLEEEIAYLRSLRAEAEVMETIHELPGVLEKEIAVSGQREEDLAILTTMLKAAQDFRARAETSTRT